MCDTFYVCVDKDDDFVRLCANYVGGTKNSYLQRQLVKIILGRAKIEEGAKAEEGADEEEGEDDSDEDEILELQLVPKLILLKDVITSIWNAGGQELPYDYYTSRYTSYEYPVYTLPTPSLTP